jgi:hypothetical protein
MIAAAELACDGFEHRATSDWNQRADPHLRIAGRKHA